MNYFNKNGGRPRGILFRFPEIFDLKTEITSMSLIQQVNCVKCQLTLFCLNQTTNQHLFGACFLFCLFFFITACIFESFLRQPSPPSGRAIFRYPAAAAAAPASSPRLQHLSFCFPVSRVSSSLYEARESLDIPKWKGSLCGAATADDLWQRGLGRILAAVSRHNDVLI